MCILLNNIETARIKLEDLDEELENSLGQTIVESFRYLKSSLIKLLGTILFRVRST